MNLKKIIWLLFSFPIENIACFQFKNQGSIHTKLFLKWEGKNYSLVCVLQAFLQTME